MFCDLFVDKVKTENVEKLTEATTRMPLHTRVRVDRSERELPAGKYTNVTAREQFSIPTD